MLRPAGFETSAWTKVFWAGVGGVGRGPGPPEIITLAQARATYETVADTTYDPSTFARDLRATGLIMPAASRRTQTGGRPAALYAFRAQEPAWGAGRRKRINPIDAP